MSAKKKRRRAAPPPSIRIRVAPPDPVIRELDYILAELSFPDLTARPD